MYKEVLAVVLLAVVCHAQEFRFGNCPKVTVVDNLDVNRYLGEWYEIKKNFFFIEVGETCIVANYSLKSDGHIQVLNRGLQSNGKVNTAIGDAVAMDPSVPAKLSVTFNGSPRAPYWVVDTDYDNYSLVWSCMEFVGLAKADFAWILSRNRTLDQSTVDTLTQKLASFGVDTSGFQPTSQENCPF